MITFISVNKLQHPLILKNNIDYSSKMGPPPFFHSDINPVFCHVLVHSVDIVWLNNGIDLVGVLEYTFVPLCSNAEQISYVQKI